MTKISFELNDQLVIKDSEGNKVHLLVKFLGNGNLAVAFNNERERQAILSFAKKTNREYYELLKIS